MSALGLQNFQALATFLVLGGLMGAEWLISANIATRTLKRESDGRSFHFHSCLTFRGVQRGWESRAKPYGPINKADFFRSSVTENTSYQIRIYVPSTIVDLLWFQTPRNLWFLVRNINKEYYDDVWFQMLLVAGLFHKNSWAMTNDLLSQK